MVRRRITDLENRLGALQYQVDVLKEEVRRLRTKVDGGTPESKSGAQK